VSFCYGPYTHCYKTIVFFYIYICIFSTKFTLHDGYGVMADTKLVLCDAVCFVKSKFGKLLSNTLKVTLSDFYSGDVLAVAKQQLLDDILDMKSSAKFPHVPRRRDGDNKAAREIDDII